MFSEKRRKAQVCIGLYLLCKNKTSLYGDLLVCAYLRTSNNTLKCVVVSVCGPGWLGTGWVGNKIERRQYNFWISFFFPKISVLPTQKLTVN